MSHFFSQSEHIVISYFLKIVGGHIGDEAFYRATLEVVEYLWEKNMELINLITSSDKALALVFGLHKRYINIYIQYSTIARGQEHSWWRTWLSL